MDDLIIKAVELSDIPDILDLFQRVFHRNISYDYYRWMFFDHVLNCSYSRGAWLGNKIISHIGYTPRDFIVNNHPGFVLMKPTTMTDKSFQGKGVYSKLITNTLKEFSNKDIHMVISVPNANSHKIHIKQNEYEDIAIIPSLTWRGNHDVSPESDFNPFNYFTKFKIYGQDCQDLCSKTIENAKYSLKLSPQYISWRFGEHPFNTYYVHEYRQGGVLRSALIFKFYPDKSPYRINIVQWLCDDDYLFASEKLFKDIIELSQKYGYEIQIWQNVYNRIRHYLLESLGFALDSPVFYFGVYPLQSKDKLGPYFDYRYWYISMGDVDVF